MKNILILTAGFGEGHNTAARSIRDAIRQIRPGEVRVEVLDLFDVCYGRINEIARKAYITAINRAPTVWSRFYRWVDKTPMLDSNLTILARMREALAELLQREQPDAVVSTYPIYNYLIEEIYEDGRPRCFRQVTVVTDSISINSVWYRAGSDTFLVPNEQTARVMDQAGVEPDRIHNFGFPVKPHFAELAATGTRAMPDHAGPYRILYMINSGKKRAPHMLRSLLALDDIALTVTVGRDENLKRQVETIVKPSDHPVEVLGWTDQMPELLHSHHLLISKAGGATMQEAIAARCPVIISQIVPGQEEGNAQLILENNGGVHAPTVEETVRQVRAAFAEGGTLWKRWYENLAPLSKPAASLDIARYLMGDV